MSKPTPLFTPRPTKYRAWNGKAMQLVHSLCWNRQGYLWYGEGNTFGWAYVYPDSDGWSAENVKPSENDIRPVMQWTGLKDRDGRDIYEGDIIAVPTELPVSDTVSLEQRFSGPIYYAEVKWDVNGYVIQPFGWTHEDIRSFRLKYGFDKRESLTGRAYLAGSNDNTLVIVGNVFENPDLLKT